MARLIIVFRGEVPFLLQHKLYAVDMAASWIFQYCEFRMDQPNALNAIIPAN